MLVGNGCVQVNGKGVKSVNTARYEIHWHGLVYAAGARAGTSSILQFAGIAESDLARAASILKGVYFVVLRDKLTGNCYAFVDNSGLYHAFYSAEFAGISFLELVKILGLRTKDLDPNALIEFFHFGAIYEEKTFFAGIHKIPADAIVRLRPQRMAELLPKPLPDVAARSDRKLEDVLRDFRASVADEKISLDLTGGIDSRLLAVVLSYFGLPFELAASGVPGNTDLRIAEQVARVVDREFHVTWHDPSETEWGELFEICDGMFDLGKADRPIQLQRARVRRGITLAVSGAGGELFKDFWWLQDFPFYRRQNPRLERLYSMRIAPAEPQHAYLGERYYQLSKSYRQRLLSILSRHTVSGNTQTYDRIYYFFKMRAFAGRFLTNSTRLLQVHAPYLEHEAVRIGYGLPRWQRFFNNYHRETITHFSAQAARIPTSEGGMTASAEGRAICADLRKYARDRATRLARKLGQRVLARTYLQESADNPELGGILRRLVENRRSLERLKDHGLLSKSVGLPEVKSSYLGPLVALDMLFEKIEINDRRETQREQTKVA